LNNPAELIELIEDIEAEIAGWNNAVSDINVESLKTASDFNDCRRSLQSSVISLEDEVHDNNEQADKLKSQQLKLSEHVADTSKKVVNIKHKAEKLLEHVSDLLVHWSAEEKKAIAWEKEATEKLKLAKAELVRAQRNLTQAELVLGNAKSDLARCENSGYTDLHGVYHPPICFGHEAAVGNALKKVARFEGYVSTAKSNVYNCSIDLRNARARLDVCVENVQVSRHGKSQAECAQSIADNAIDCRAQAHKALQAVNTKMDEIIVNQSKQRKFLDAMQQAVHQCKDRLASATDVSFNIKGHVAASDDLSAQAKYVLSDLVEKLEEFDFVGDF